LFATLDTTVRKVVIENLPFLVSDTVGFIRKLPTHLVESFKSTLDEVREADILIHVVDISHANYEEQIQVVEETLRELGSGDTPELLVFNKTDAFTYISKEEDDLTPSGRENLSLEDMKRQWNGNRPGSIFISALKKTNIDELKDRIYQMVKEIHVQRYPYNDFLY
jgi:GTP-binding protein HflX